MRVVHAVILGLVFGGGCTSIDSGDASIMVRVQNDRAQAIEVSIGPADYGEIGPSAVSDYLKVGNCGNDVVVDGQPFASAEFCCASGGAEGFCKGHWTYFIDDVNGGFTSDDFGAPAGSGGD